ncbi:SUMF1/EgtB/PvdO family nonheme iron enzyme [Alteromonas gracilis]|uniref:SUMF1/EgtB/PvdO family nonheme iron enzyme n=1 Tax=Alteromonas gracilis TaxID=1479524 RepID=UPI003735820E
MFCSRSNILTCVTAFSLLTISTSGLTADYIPPPMVNIPAGQFFMGTENGGSETKPMHQVSVKAFQMGKYPVTVAEFRKFTASTGYQMPATCHDYIDENWLGGPEVGSAKWDKHRYLKSEFQPVTCITYKDANAYVSWISEKAGINYRLPSEQEWEYATKGNTSSRYFWGDDENLTNACKYGNFADYSGEYFASSEYGASYKGFIGHTNCDDGEPYISIVGLYRPNPFGLYDMVGNVSQLLATCFYPGYEKRSNEEMDLKRCEHLSHRGSSWHFPPQPHALRSRTDREPRSASSLMGFRLATDGHSSQTHANLKAFEETVLHAQQKRRANRTQILDTPSALKLVSLQRGHAELSWQPIKDKRAVSYDIYRSTTHQAHRFGQYYRRHFEKWKTVPASQHSVRLKASENSASYLVVANARDISSLPSKAVALDFASENLLPGRLTMRDMAELKGSLLAYRKPTDGRPELHYISKVSHDFDQNAVLATFNIHVQKSGLYRLNYRGKSRVQGEFFSLWQNDKLIGKIDYNKNVDDKSSDRHSVFLEEGSHTLEVKVTRSGFDYWNLVWLEFTSLDI